MMNETNYFEIINLLIAHSRNVELIKLLPISKEKLYGNDDLCDMIVDFLSDLQMIRGFDVNYNETKEGKMISKVIDFILLCNEQLI